MVSGFYALISLYVYAYNDCFKDIIIRRYQKKDLFYDRARVLMLTVIK